jgi:hypothetical protein
MNYVRKVGQFHLSKTLLLKRFLYNPMFKHFRSILLNAVQRYDIRFAIPTVSTSACRVEHPDSSSLHPSSPCVCWGTHHQAKNAIPLHHTSVLASVSARFRYQSKYIAGGKSQQGSCHGVLPRIETRRAMTHSQTEIR